MKKIFVIFAIFFLVSCDSGMKPYIPSDKNSGKSEKSEAEKTDDDTEKTDPGSPDDDNGQTDASTPENNEESQNDDSGDTGTTPKPDEDNTAPSERKQGELYGECYPNETCNKGLICDVENNICVKENYSTSDDDGDTSSDADEDEETSAVQDADPADPDGDPDPQPDNDTDTPAGDHDTEETGDNDTETGDHDTETGDHDTETGDHDTPETPDTDTPDSGDCTEITLGDFSYTAYGHWLNHYDEFQINFTPNLGSSYYDDELYLYMDGGDSELEERPYNLADYDWNDYLNDNYGVFLYLCEDYYYDDSDQAYCTKRYFQKEGTFQITNFELNAIGYMLASFEAKLYGVVLEEIYNSGNPVPGGPCLKIQNTTLTY